MPHLPEPDEDDLDAVPPPLPVFHVEKALLGALLIEPQRLHDVARIGPSAFSTTEHAAVFTAIHSLPAPDPAEHAQTTTWFNAVLTAARERTPGLSAPYLHSLIQTCPRPRHAAVYARMIEAEHCRRRLSAAAQRLVHSAQDTSLPQRLLTTLEEADALAGVVADIAARFPPHAGPLPSRPQPPPELLQDQEAVDDERCAIATATAYPSSIEQMRWLTPRDFSQPLHAGLWQCLNTLARRGTPVDAVTVMWEAQHRELLAREADPQQILNLLDAAVGSPQDAGERVLAHSLLATAYDTGRLVRAFADDPATTPGQLVAGSRRALADLNAVRTRWQHATSPPSAPTERPGPPPAPPAPPPPPARPPRPPPPPPAPNTPSPPPRPPATK
ncbi:DnaB-like helicase N-terminal domain-containing protein, partial [Streptomyces sp. 8L]|uniref:DnaB-like helicase N-terminal domain-containing protein n=1 Tax=Streptomyces sp. 8L TaxID=2877242 RepID=UPI001CD4480A